MQLVLLQGIINWEWKSLTYIWRVILLIGIIKCSGFLLFMLFLQIPFMISEGKTLQTEMDTE